VSSLRARAAITLAAIAGVSTIAACEKHDFEPPSRAQRVGAADTLLTEETFDTVAWPSDSARAYAGNNAYAAHCRGCHGYLGRGDTDYAREHRIAVPSLVRPDWPYQDLPAVRRRIFTGHPAGMPTWGVAGIAPREIDATAYYLLYVLRPEVLGTGR
jgi:mono/diheme cytochrome c family protein